MRGLRYSQCCYCGFSGTDDCFLRGQPGEQPPGIVDCKKSLAKAIGQRWHDGMDEEVQGLVENLAEAMHFVPTMGIMGAGEFGKYGDKRTKLGGTLLLVLLERMRDVVTHDLAPQFLVGHEILGMVS